MTEKTDLVSKKEIDIRFSEVDSMGIVWHGHYVKYMEDGREDFGKKFGFTYLDIFNNGFYAPLTNINIDYCSPMAQQQRAIVETKYIKTDAAKIIFEYRITSLVDGKLVLRAKSTQVFLDKDYQLVWTNPDFYSKWKESVGII